MGPTHRDKLLDFVLLCGGNTLVQGFDDRIKRELTMMCPSGVPIKVVRALDAELDAWRGGVMLAQDI